MFQVVGVVTTFANDFIFSWLWFLAARRSLDNLITLVWAGNFRCWGRSKWPRSLRLLWRLAFCYFRAEKTFDSSVILFAAVIEIRQINWNTRKKKVNVSYLQNWVNYFRHTCAMESEECQFPAYEQPQLPPIALDLMSFLLQRTLLVDNCWGALPCKLISLPRFYLDQNTGEYLELTVSVYEAASYAPK
jgi:hypothetical protein